MSLKAIGGGVCAAKGFTAGGVLCGIREGRATPDLMMILCETQCAAAAVYTRNKVQGAPIAVTREHLQDGYARGALCNSGNANTCAPGGVEVARACCALAAEATGAAPEDFIVASTGVIGRALPLGPFERGIPRLARSLSKRGGEDAAMAIMTTDTVKKEFAAEFELGGKVCRLGGICKGSGMININMATMLAFLTTDADISPAMLRRALRDAAAPTFNQVCVDGDTSTNDMACILASGFAGNAKITRKGGDYDVFLSALRGVCEWMSRALAADGEGATKLLECVVSGAPGEAIARKIAKTVIASDLLKAAMFGRDANWGRVLCAIGYAPGDFPVGDISLVLKSAAGEITVCEHSAHRAYSEEDAARILAERHIHILADLHAGSYSGVAWGCDLTYDYVKINGDYRS